MSERLIRMQEDHGNGYHAHLRPNDCPLCYPDSVAEPYRTMLRVERLRLGREMDRLWDAVDHLWGELDVETVRRLREDQPELVELARHAHHRMSHEQRMMR